MSTLLTLAAQALAQSPFFHALSPRARDALAARGVEHKLAPGERLFSKGDEGDSLFVLLEGEVEIGVAAADGRQVRFGALGAGAVIGELAAIDGGPRSADVTALRRSRLLRLGRESVLETLQTEPPALMALAAELAARLRKADMAIETAALADLGAKLARHLWEESQGGQRLVQLTQGEMARRIGVSREKLNRKLADWRKQGLIDVTRAGLRVLSPARLAGLAGGDSHG